VVRFLTLADPEADTSSFTVGVGSLSVSKVVRT